jgi:hypothetical protein
LGADVVVVGNEYEGENYVSTDSFYVVVAAMTANELRLLSNFLRLPTDRREAIVEYCCPLTTRWSSRLRNEFDAHRPTT